MTTAERSGAWTAEQLTAITRANELEIAVRRTDGAAGVWTPIWAVVVGEHVFVRTWVLRTTGWYGRAVRSGAARMRVPGVEEEVAVEPDASTAAAVDAAYRGKYGDAGAASMTTDEAVASTLRLLPRQPGGERSAAGRGATRS